MADIKTLKKKKYVRIYNHGSSVVCVTLEKKQMTVKAKNDQGKPGHIDVTWDDLEFLNDSTEVFRYGTLRFAKEDEQALYHELAIENYKDILFNEVLEDIILRPTLVKLQRIIDITSISIIERANGILTWLLNNDVEISSKVVNVIRRRKWELQMGRRISNVSTTTKKPIVPANVEDVNSLKDEIALLKAMIKEVAQGQSES